METLETLLTQCNDDENLLDAAEERWGMEDYRFLVLQERPRPSAKVSDGVTNPVRQSACAGKRKNVRVWKLEKIGKP